MIFKYKDIQTSLDVMNDYEIVRDHRIDIIRNINVKEDATLIYPEPLDESLIELISETIVEEKLLLSSAIANNFYYDNVRKKYLGVSLSEVQFYLSGTNKKNQYLYQVHDIRSNLVPFKISEEYCIVGYEFFSISDVDGNVISIKDGQGQVLLDVYSNNSSNSEDFSIDLLIDNTNISGYINGTGLDAPVLKLYLRKTYYPVGA